MTQPLASITPEELARLPRPEEAGFGSLATARGHLPLVAMDVSARLCGLEGEIRLEQTFENRHDEPIEATYIFPLPDRAAVTGFRMRLGERVVEGVIRERGEARRDYDRAIAAGHRAAITEEDRSGVFTMRVGNLLPGDRAVVELTLTGPLPIDEGEATFRFPLVVAPRYIPGAPLAGPSAGDGVADDTDAVPDASRITPPVLLPGHENPVRLSLRVDLDPVGLPLSDLRSSLHAVVEEVAPDGRRRIALRPGERLDRDFVLRFRLGDDAVRTSLVLARDAEGAEGTFALTLLPPAGLAGAARPRDLVLVLDRSGSMGGWKMVAARRAAARMIDTLTDRDRFAVLAFDHDIDRPASLPEDALAPATDRNRFRAVEFLAGLEARGGTEMARPLERAASLLGGGYRDRERIVVLVTDGQVGNEDQILRRLSPRISGSRVFALGIDRAVNEGFLKRLAALGGGCFELVESEDRLDDVMARIHRRIGTPVVTELSLEPRGLDLDRASVVPERLPDLFAGAPVTIRGRFRGAPEGEIVVTGQDALGEHFEERVTGRAAKERAAASLWARETVRALEDRYAIGAAGDPGELARRIVSVSLRFGVLCRFTAFLAVDREERVNPGGDPHRVIQPVEAPSGWGMFGASEDAGDLVAASLPASMMLDADEESASAEAFATRSAPPMPPIPSGPSAPPAPMPLPASAPPRAGGVLSNVTRALGRPLAAAGRLRRAMSGGSGAGGRGAGGELPEVGLGAYAGRIARIGEVAAAEPDPGRRARALAIAIAALVEDLSSVGAPAEILDPLAACLAELRRVVAAAGPLEPVLSRAGEVLARAEAACRDGASPEEPARGDFWK